MGADSKIEWTDASWTPIRARHVGFDRSPDNPGGGVERIGWHCGHVSEGCRNCYAETMNRRLGTGLDYKPGNLAHKNRFGEHRHGATIFLDEKMLLAPLRWKKPRRIFVCSMTDLFGAWVPDDMIDRIFAVMALCPQHTFQVLTKRPERMRDYMGRSCGRIADAVMSLRPSLGIKSAIAPLPHITPGAEWWPLANVWLGTSVEDQATADARIPLLLDTPAAVRFLSCEPLLGVVDLTRIAPGQRIRGAVSCEHVMHALLGGKWDQLLRVPDEDGPNIKWVIAGGESGHGARPMHPDWARGLRDQCAAAGVPFFFKQWGEWVPLDSNNDGKPLPGESDRIWYPRPDLTTVARVGKKRAGRLLDGVQHDGVPA